MNVLKRDTAARAAPTVKERSSAGVKQATSSGLTGAAARLWVRSVGLWQGGQRAERGEAARRSVAQDVVGRQRDFHQKENEAPSDILGLQGTPSWCGVDGVCTVEGSNM